MTVRELIAELSDIDPDLRVMLSHHEAPSDTSFYAEVDVVIVADAQVLLF